MAELTATARTRGGGRLARILRNAGRGGVGKVEVGFFSEARYRDGTPVAAVAAWNEFGTKRTPERPFFRQAIEAMDAGIVNILHAGIDPTRGIVTHRLADTIGAYAAGQVQASITRLKEPPNAPATEARKKSNNPLIDIGDHARISHVDGGRLTVIGYPELPGARYACPSWYGWARHIGPLDRGQSTQHGRGSPR